MKESSFTWFYIFRYMSKLDTLPVEILHRIFDHLDASTIIRSIRCVCKHLYAVVNSYDRFQLNFTQFNSPNSLWDLEGQMDETRNSDLKAVLRFIQSSKVISLVLSGSETNQNGIKIFLENFSINEFTNLRSLSLSQISNDNVNRILPHVTTRSLVSLSISLRQIPSSEVISTIFSAIIQTNLQRLCLNNLNNRNIEIPWPGQDTLQQLTIKTCTYQEFCIILGNSRNLRTFVIENYVMNNVNATGSSYAIAASNSAKRQRVSIDSTGTATDS